MHLPKNMYEDSIKSLCSLLKPHGKIVMSYGVTPRREETERYFEEVDNVRLETLFNKCGCTKKSSVTNQDGLKEREIMWTTEVYSYDKF